MTTAAGTRRWTGKKSILLSLYEAMVSVWVGGSGGPYVWVKNGVWVVDYGWGAVLKGDFVIGSWLGGLGWKANAKGQSCGAWVGSRTRAGTAGVVCKPNRVHGVGWRVGGRGVWAIQRALSFILPPRRAPPPQSQDSSKCTLVVWWAMHSSPQPPFLSPRPTPDSPQDTPSRPSQREQPNTFFGCETRKRGRFF